MEDMDLYGWDRLHAFHETWLHQLEQGRSTWSDSDHKLRIRRAFVWHVAWLPGPFCFLVDRSQEKACHHPQKLQCPGQA